jgi:hypothetical protein
MDSKVEKMTLQQPCELKKYKRLAEEKAPLIDEMPDVIEEVHRVRLRRTALYGFQTMAPFNHRFMEIMGSTKLADLTTCGCLTLGIRRLVASAASSRWRSGAGNPQYVNRSLTLLRAGMLTLMFAFAISNYGMVVAAFGKVETGLFATLDTAPAYLVVSLLAASR